MLTLLNRQLKVTIIARTIMSRHTIALLNDSFPPVIDGVTNAVVNYGRCIEQNHGHAIVVTPEVPGSDDSIYDFPVIRYPSIDTRKLMGYVTGYPFSPEAAYRLKEENAELLHIHCPMMSALLARQLHESMDLPLVLTWHTKYDIDIANVIRSKAIQEGALQALLWNVNACNEVWTVSHGAGENLKSIGYEGEYIVMPNGVDLPHERVSEELIAEATAGYDLPEDVPCYLFIGRLMWYKGLRIILDALSQLDSHGIDFRMVFVGAGGDEAEVKEYTQKLGLGCKVFFTEAISERDLLRAWYSRADLFLFPSTFDTNGLVVREAAASDTASVIIAGSCASEGITDGRNGFLIEENADALAAKLTELSHLPGKTKEVGETAGREIYISWEDAVANAYGRYEVVIDRYRSGYYKTRLPYDYDFFRAQGELMETLGNIDAARHSIIKDAEELRGDMDRKARSIRNKALTDIITAGYETRQELKSMKNDAEQLIQSKKEAALESIESVRKEFWETLDRYL